MTDQLPSTLEDLKKAIEAVPLFPGDDSSAGMTKLMVAAGEHHARRADAWRTAFEWLQQIGAETDHALNIRRNTGSSALLIAATLEKDDGMRLIRQKLK